MEIVIRPDDILCYDDLFESLQAGREYRTTTKSFYHVLNAIKKYEFVFDEMVLLNHDTEFETFKKMVCYDPKYFAFKAGDDDEFYFSNVDCFATSFYVSHMYQIKIKPTKKGNIVFKFKVSSDNMKTYSEFTLKIKVGYIL